MHMHSIEHLAFLMLVSRKKKQTSLHQATGLSWNFEARVGWARLTHGHLKEQRRLLGLCTGDSSLSQ
jgi:hypothetical protein